ncbi:hypothetical protein BH20ACI2_BH20ACI2_13100 [soil metagenome]
MIRKVEYQGIPNCIQISNSDATLIISTEVGSRVLFYGYDEGENVLGWHPHAAVETGLGTWKPYGGHRLWVAPENMPLSYAPDNDPIDYEPLGELSAVFRSSAGKGYPVDKEVTISLAATGTSATIGHRLTSRGDSEIEIASWALTIMRPGGTVIVPNEPLVGYGPENLLPVRSMALWPYTDFTDPRWSFEKDHIRLRVDQSIQGPQKFGVLNKQGWAAYEWNSLRFVKRSEYIGGSVYPDMNSNFEFYTDGGFVEIETLSPLRSLSRGESVEHKETWELGPSSS